MSSRGGEVSSRRTVSEVAGDAERVDRRSELDEAPAAEPDREAHRVAVDLTPDSSEVFSWLQRDPEKCAASTD